MCTEITKERNNTEVKYINKILFKVQVKLLEFMLGGKVKRQ